MYLPLETPSGIRIDFTETETAKRESDASERFKGLDDIDLRELIYELKYTHSGRDKTCLEAAQRELERRGASTVGSEGGRQ